VTQATEALGPVPPGTGVLARIRAAMPGLAPSDAAVASLIERDPEAVMVQSISDVADAAGTSASTVVRCSQRLGFKGFQELRLELARELGARGSLATVGQREGSSADILEHVLTTEIAVIRNVTATLDLEQFDAAVAAVAAGRRVLFIGNASSASFVHHAGFTGRLVGLAVEAPTETDAQDAAAALLGAGDVCVALTQTGAGRATVATQGVAREAGATTIAITAFTHSPITEVTDHVLVAGGDPSAPYRLESIPARLALHAVLDALFIAVAVRNQPQSDAAFERVMAAFLRHYAY
jgi:DNA-binding MurR/RpiR family transcriptional regulator